jgi:IS4 transposase
MHNYGVAPYPTQGGCTMKEVEALKRVFQSHMPINAARLHCLVAIIIGLLKVRTVNFTEIADAFPGRAEKDSRYKRIQRFFRSYRFDYDMIAIFLVRLIGIKDLRFEIIIDRTNWKFGKFNINVLTLAIAHCGNAFPIFWMLLPKRGNSNTQERITLMERFIRVFGLDKISCLFTDREFIGKAWFSYLIERFIKFRARIKENTLVTNSRGKPVPAKNFFRSLKPEQYRVLEGKRCVLGHELFVIGLKQLTGEYVILVTKDDPETAMEDYKRRWGIETMFGCFKTRGFNFESTHLTDMERIEKLVAVLAIAFCWCHVTGEWIQTKKPIKIKKHGRKATSIFRYGLDTLRETLLNMSEKKKVFKKLIKLLIYVITSSPLAESRTKHPDGFLSCT